jgi:hypothetical protein
MREPDVGKTLDPANPSSWAMLPFETLFALPRAEVEAAQQAAFALRFETLRPRLEALDKLATRQGYETAGSVEEAIPVFFDHRVLKGYPMSILEKGQYDRLTKWLQRLTTVDLAAIPLDGVESIDSWIDRLDEHGMLIGHSTGTTGKLSFVPRSQVEWPAWSDSYFESGRAATGIDTRVEAIPSFWTSYRRGHQMSVKMGYLFACASAGGDARRHCLYDGTISADLLSLMGRYRAAERRGALDKLHIEPRLLAQREALVKANANREHDLEAWFTKLADEFRSQRVRITGQFSDLTRLAIAGQEKGLQCEFAPDSLLSAGGGMKGYKDAPVDWQQRIMDFFGVDKIHKTYGMSESMAMAPMCRAGFYHFFPYTIPIALDEDFVALPRQGAQTGRLAVFDILPETYWGGFVSGDLVTIHFDGDCACGWKGVRMDTDVTRFSEIEGVDDDKISCAGTVAAYTEFMDYMETI